ncbi:uncharacterized protein LTR77_010270 [Saxophila tyrrhenica]|uniref:Nudix hydrolase domain-containing protein n=1 Tax=Saxophila tyrrhenica TaxID=1690608 RepID=A0AAV9NVQ3_9PEZI|nr:hypothetical protein LTR77_010270 [Saxophila tyrrhenica]
MAQPPRENHVRVGVGVFVFKDHNDAHFVLGKRKASLGAGTYSLPGGHLEFGETFEQCAVREVKEETGLEIGEVRYLTTVETTWEEEGKQYVTIFMAGCAKAGHDGGEAVPQGQGFGAR